MIVLLAVFAIYLSNRQARFEQKPLPSPIHEAQASPILKGHKPDVACYPSGDPPVSPKKLEGPGEFYDIAFTQAFTIANGTDYYQKFTMTCQILQGPSRDSEKTGTTELIVKPRGFAGNSYVRVRWPRAYKSDQLKEFHYVCGCTHKKVDRPFKTFKMPFVPSE